MNLLLSTLGQDLQFAVRGWWRAPGLAVAAVLSLAIGLGANTSVFGLVERLLVRPLPVVDPGALVTLAVGREDGRGEDFHFSHPLYQDYRDGNRVLEGLTACHDARVTLRVGEEAERGRALVVSANYFDVLGVTPLLGRWIGEADNQAGAPDALVLGHGYWQRRFGGDPGAIGRTVILNGRTFLVTGVARPGFVGTLSPLVPEVYVPMRVAALALGASPGSADPLTSRHLSWLRLLGRLKPGVDRAEAQAAFSVLAARIEQEHPVNTSPRILLGDGSQGHTYNLRSARLPLLMVQLTVGLLLLIACANVANLLLVRLAGRHHEFAIRLSLGATRWRLIRQVVTESVLLALLGGAAGLLVAQGLGRVLARFRPPGVEAGLETGLDWRSWLFCLGLSVATGVGFGLLPAARMIPSRVVSGLGQAGGWIRSTMGAVRLRGALVVMQLALALILLISAGLCVRSARHLQQLDPGFVPEGVVMVPLDLDAAHHTGAAGERFLGQVLERLAAIPGVLRVTAANTVPLSGSITSISVNGIEGFEFRGPGFLAVPYSLVAPGYFETLGVSLRQGRTLDAGDRAGGPGVVVVNQAFVDRFLPGVDAIGRTIRVPDMRGGAPRGGGVSLQAAGERVMEIVGVVQTGRYRSLMESPTPMMFWPLAQAFTGNLHGYVRCSADPRMVLGAIRGALKELDPDLPSGGVRTLEEQRVGSLFLQRLAAEMLGGFGVVGLVLAVLGVYAVMAFSVAQRTREIGVRMALGAQVRDIGVLVMRQGVWLTLLGLGFGLVGAFAVARLMRSLLHGVSPADPWTYGVVLAVLGVATLVACLVSARKAVRVQPAEALRSE